ncbi:hypothetical protein Gotri_004679, partial [Gossypium trilobum]|nr:hypothetical protein [Gossypium trilobum]
ADSAALASGWTRYAHFGFAVIDQFDRENSKTLVTTEVFDVNGADWGFTSFLPLTELHNPKRGYLVNDACLVEAYVFTDRSIGFISHELIVKTDSGRLKTKESDCVKAAMDNQRTASTKAVEITNPSPTPPYCQIMKQVEKRLAALHVQVEEAQKERENMLAEGKEIFKSSKEMKMELEALEMQWAEYEAMAKVAEEEESIVLAEWGRIKDFISSIKGKI